MILKLVIAIVRDDDGNKLLHELNKEGFSVTKMASTGGFLKSGNTTLMIGTEVENVENVISIITKKCERSKQVVLSPNPSGAVGGMYSSFPIEIDVGGATIFVIDVERFEKI